MDITDFLERQLIKIRAEVAMLTTFPQTNTPLQRLILHAKLDLIRQILDDAELT